MTREDLIELLSQHEGILDDLVHDATSQVGTNINNGGVESQLQYLLEEGMHSEILDLAEMIFHTGEVSRKDLELAFCEHQNVSVVEYNREVNCLDVHCNVCGLSGSLPITLNEDINWGRS